MIQIYSPEEIEKIKAGGKITAAVLAEVLEKVAAGMTTKWLDEFAHAQIKERGGEASFKMEKGYSFATCMNVNEMVVHGVPTEEELKEGDRLGVDLGVYYQGYHTDASWSIQVKSRKLKAKSSYNDDAKPKIFLETGERALKEAIRKCVAGNYIGEISRAIQETVEAGGYSCVKQLVGHGVGRKLHEDPEIPGYLRGKVENTPEIKVGMVLAIEVIYNLGKSGVVYGSDDGWTIVTRDGLLSGLFEHTVAVTAKGTDVVTSGKDEG